LLQLFMKITGLYNSSLIIITCIQNIALLLLDIRGVSA
jgi:hypothetical protein